MTSTRPVPSGNGYTAPETSQSRMIAEWQRGHQKVDHNGFPLPTATDPTVTPVVGGPDPITPVPATPPTGTPSGSHTPVPTPGTPGSLLERLQAKAQAQLDQPLPPGSTTV